MEENGIRTCERCRGLSSGGSSSGVDLRPNDEVLCTVCWIDSLSSRQDNTSNQFLAGSEDQLKTENIGEAEPEKANSEPTRSNYENQVEVSSSVFNNKDKKDFGTNDIHPIIHLTLILRPRQISATIAGKKVRTRQWWT